MENDDRLPLSRAAKHLGTYERLVLGFAARHGVTYERKGRVRYFKVADLEKLRPDIEAWHNRPRLAELTPA